jgi:hypothetical protein
MLTELQKAEIIADCSAHLSRNGVFVQQISDFSKVLEMVRAAGKNYLTPLSSPEYNDLTQGGCIWLVGMKDGTPAMLGGARLEDLKGEGVSSFWPRTLGRVYGRETQDLIEEVSPELTSRLNGRLAYFCDLHVMQNSRGMRSNLRAFTAIGHLLVSLKWDPDHTCAFVRENDVMRGADRQYGFSDTYANPMVWRDPPAPRSNSEWCAVLPREKLQGMMRAVRSSIREECGSQMIKEA